MIALLDTPNDLKVCQEELGCPVEQLFTPLTRRAAQDKRAHFAIDNGAFSNFDPKMFLNLLKLHEDRSELCRFVAVPDVVGSARRTLELFEHWRPILFRWPLALVAQDGLEDFPIDWMKLDAIFIGGTSKWKMSQHAIAVLKTAKSMGKWVHVGRVNTPARFEHFEELGADSIDGTGLSRYTHMRERIFKQEQGSLPLTNEPEELATTQ